MKTNTEIAKSIISDIKWTIEAYEKGLKRLESQSESLDDKVLKDLDNIKKSLNKLSKAIDSIDKQYTAPFMNIGIVDTPAKSISIRVNNVLIRKVSGDVFNVIFKEDAGF